MAIDIDKLKKTIDEVRKDLGDGFVATDVWTATDTKSLIFSFAGSDMYTFGMTSLPSLFSKTRQNNKRIGSYRGDPKVIALFGEVTQKLGNTLASAAYPGIGNYYLINLENNHLLLVLTAGSYQQFLLVDLSKTTMGILMGVALPKLLESLGQKA